MDSERSSHKLFDRLRASGVHRSDSQWLGGVASGLAERFRVDSVLVRGISVALALLGGVGLIAYGLAWAFLPDERGRIHFEQALQKNWTTGMTGALITFLLGIGPAQWIFSSITPYLWPLLVIAVVLFIVFSRKNTKYAAAARRRPAHQTGDAAGETIIHDPLSPERPQPPGRGPGQVPVDDGFTASAAGHQRSRTTEWSGNYKEEYFMAPDPSEESSWSQPAARASKPRTAPPMPGWLAMIMVGVTALLMALVFGFDYLGPLDYPGGAWSLALSLGLLFVGLVLVFTALMRRTSGGLLGLAIPLLVLSLVFGNTGYGFSNTSGFGTPAGGVIQQDAEGNYNAAFSNATIDLRHYEGLATSRTVDVNTAFANLELLLPGDVPVRVETDGLFLNQSGDQPMTRSAAENDPVLTVEIDGAFSRIDLSVASAPAPATGTDS